MPRIIDQPATCTSTKFEATAGKMMSTTPNRRTAALRDTAWIAATRTRLAADRQRLDRTLGDAGLKLIGGTDLFGLFEARDGLDVLDHFARAGILVRGFAAAPRRYRFGLPGDEAAWHRLDAACAALG